MSDAEEAQDNIQVGDTQVGAVAGVKDPGDIMWRSTAWSAGAEAVASAKVATS